MIPKFRQLADMPEDDRIDAMGRTVLEKRAIVGCITDAEPGKADRYIEKMKRKFPDVRVIDRQPGPVPETVLIRFGPPLEG